MSDNRTIRLIQYIDSKRNILLHAPGGTGKTFLMRQVVRHYIKHNVNIQVCALTAIASLNFSSGDDDNPIPIDARTLHSTFGLGFSSDRPFQEIIDRMGKNTKRIIRSLRILVIEEISMVGRKFFKKIDNICRHVRNSEEPFGGIQIIMVGDFYQIAPIKDKWVFSTKYGSPETEIRGFYTLNPVYLTLSQSKRYSSDSYYEFLMRARKGDLTHEDVKMLRSKLAPAGVCVSNEDSKEDPARSALTEVGGGGGGAVKPTMLNSKKVDVYQYNIDELAKIPGKKKVLTAVDYFVSDRIYNDFLATSEDNFDISELVSLVDPDTDIPEEGEKKLEDMIPNRVETKTGAQMMLKANISITQGLVNGSRCVVTKIEKAPPAPAPAGVSGFQNSLKKLSPSGGGVIFMCKFNNGIEYPVSPHYFIVKVYGGYCIRRQYPLILASSLTIHNCQGLSLDSAICNLGSSLFGCAMGYVMLSRIRSIDGLFLSDLDVKRINSDPDVDEFVESIEFIDLDA